MLSQRIWFENLKNAIAMFLRANIVILKGCIHVCSCWTKEGWRQVCVPLTGHKNSASGLGKQTKSAGILEHPHSGAVLQAEICYQEKADTGVLFLRFQAFLPTYIVMSISANSI